MFVSILSVQSLFLAMFLLMAGSGFLSTLMSLRLGVAGTAPLLIGLIGTAYFLGLTAGAMRAAKIIGRVGHIRAFAAFVSLFSASALACALKQDVALWAILRFIQGISLAGVFICVESWLNERAEAQTRGAILASYMIAIYAGQAVGQFLLNLGNLSPAFPFMAASILLSLAVLPVVLTHIAGPSLNGDRPLSFRKIYAISPFGTVGAAITGLMLGAFYALGAVYVHGLGMGRSATAVFMSVVILGGVVLQLPIGRMSDRFDRRRVIVGAFMGAVLVSIAMAVITGPGWPLLVLGCLFGGLVFTLYPLCVAHTNDYLSPDQRVAASGGLVLIYSIGAAIGPILASVIMTGIGPAGLFVFMALCAGGAVAFGVWRQRTRVAVPNEMQQPYQILPRTTPVSAVLDPRAGEES